VTKKETEVWKVCGKKERKKNKYARTYREKGKDRNMEKKKEVKRKKFGKVYREKTEKSTEHPAVRVTSRGGCSFLLYQTACHLCL
jgi:sRNA-binding protein